MKFLRNMVALLFVVAILQGCNTNDKNGATTDTTDTNTDKNEVVETPGELTDKAEETTDAKEEETDAKEDELENANATEEDVASIPFKDFDLDVEYADNQEYDVDYENKLDQDKVEAKIKDKMNNKELKGDAAFQELKPVLEKLKFDATTADDEVIKEVLAAFDLKEDYTEFELEVEFNDGTKKKYKLK